MEATIQHILLIEDNPGDTRLLKEFLHEADFPLIKLECVEQLQSGLEFLIKNKPDLILLDLGLPDSQGLGTFLQVHAKAPDVAIVVLTGLNDAEQALEAVRAGAQDYLVKGEVEGDLLARAIRYAFERKQSELALQASERQLRFVSDHAPVMIAQCDLHQRYKFVNLPYAEMFDRQPFEMVGKLVSEILDPETYEAANPYMAAALAGKPVDFELKIRTADGTDRSIHTSYAPEFDADGKVTGFVAAITDISELKRVDEALRESNDFNTKLLETIPFGMDIINYEGQILFISTSMQKILGKDIIGKHCWELYRDDKKQCQECPLLDNNELEKTKIIETGGVLGGRIFEISHTGMVFQGQPAILEVFHDVTQRKQAEKELHKRLSELEVVYASSLAINQLLKPEEIGMKVISLLLDRFSWHHATVCRYNNESNSFELLAFHQNNLENPQDELVAEARFMSMLSEREESFAASIIKHGQTIYSGDVSKDPRYIEVWPDIHSVITVPMKVSNKIVGFLSVSSEQKNAFSETDEWLLSTLASQTANALENASLISEIKKQVDRLEALRKIDETINASLDLHVTADVILAQILQQLDVDAANFLVFDSGTKTLNYVRNLGFLTSALQHSNVHLGQGLAGQAAVSGQILHVSDLKTQVDFLDASPLLVEEKFVEYYGVPLIAKGNLIGLIEIYNRSHRVLDDGAYNFMVALAGQSAIAVENIELFRNLQKSINDLTIAYDENIEAWSHALDLRDKETEGHTKRVEKITLRIAKSMGISGDDLIHIRRGALLHDIGKMGIPDNILLKPGPLTKEEWSIMRKHPVYAFELLSPIAFLRPALDIPYCHHEKWDGTGYPRGLKGEQIPLAARIFAIVDVWDALRSDRPYRPAWPEMKTMEYIREQSGSHFDPAIVELFLNSYIFEDVSILKPTILIVDDEENVTRSLARSLRNDFIVLTANSGMEAIEIVKRSNPMVVLTDQRMPGMTGVELLENIRRIKPETVGILISGYSDVSVLITLVNLGNVSGFIPKPWDYDFLRKKLDEAVRQYREIVRRNQETS